MERGKKTREGHRRSELKKKKKEKKKEKKRGTISKGDFGESSERRGWSAYGISGRIDTIFD